MRTYVYIFLFSLTFSLAGFSQPFLDVVNAEYTNSIKEGVFRRQNTGNRYGFLNAGLTVPVLFKSDSSILVISPAFENWKVKTDNLADLPAGILSLKAAVGFIKPVSSKWTFSASIIPRWNGYNSQLLTKDNFQFGLAGLVSYKAGAGLVLKGGVYYNPEFFGTFIMPLIGIEWKINEYNNLFGVLPGSMTFEHKISARLFTGAFFKAITNSYQAGIDSNRSAKRFLRIDENQLTFFADVYITKHIVLYIQAGHSVLRQFRLGTVNAGDTYYYKVRMNDGFLFKTGVAYRLRFR